MYVHHSRDLHGLRLFPGHRRPGLHLDLADRGRGADPRNARAVRAGWAHAAERLRLPVDEPAPELALRLVRGVGRPHGIHPRLYRAEPRIGPDPEQPARDRDYA